METILLIGAGVLVYFLFFSKGDTSEESQKKEGPEIQELFDDQDDLATFRILYGHEEEESTNETPGYWVRPNESIKVDDYVITGGNFYWGGKLDSVDGYETEASLVDDSLQIQKADVNFCDETLGYWAKYTRLSPQGRGAYLNWLSGSRENPDTPIGYVFIYFYGLERRIIFDSIHGKVDNKEFQDIFNEINRLKSIYGENHSFLYYSSRLSELMCLIRPGMVNVKYSEMTCGSILFKHRLATTVDARNAVPPELALAWIRNHQEYCLRTPARRCANEFSQLFKKRYTEKFDGGLVIKPNKTRLKIEYHPASRSLRGINIEQPDLPDPSILKGPVKKLIAIADSCTDELDAYSRYLGRKNTSRNDIAALLLLPDELVNPENSSIIGKFRQWADSQIADNSGLVSVSDVWCHTGTALPARINKKEAEIIANLAEKAGYGIAPDPRFHRTKPNIDGKIVLFKGGHGASFVSSQTFDKASIALRLGSLVATIDKHIDAAEKTVLHKIIDHNTMLSSSEKCSLHAYLHWCLNSPENMARLKAKMNKLNQEEKNEVRHILISVALADGKISPAEIKQLEKLYTTLGLDKSSVMSDVHELSSVRGASSTGSYILGKLGKKSATRDTLNLDDDLLALHEMETKNVQHMLDAIFSDENDTLEEDAQKAKAPSFGNSLDKEHSALFSLLTSKKKWTRNEMEEQCQKLGLMVDGAIETINEWSFDIVDAPVLDDNDSIYVDIEIIEELKRQEVNV